MFHQSLQLFFIILFTILSLSYPKDSNLKKRQLSHTIQEVDDYNLSRISRLSDNEHFNEILDNILLPRVVGTPGHAMVRNYIVNFFQNLQWQVELDSFEDDTPNLGRLQFHNIITTLNPNADRYLLLACHYDSKYFPNGDQFLGATDSAVPCAMLLDLAHILKDYLNQNRLNNEVSLKFVFFDGEEAFLEWTSTDSIYGARHLAAKWEREQFLPRIDMLILLDLIGVPDPSFYSFFKQTENWYARFCIIEERLANAGLMEQYTYSSVVSRTPNQYFQARSTASYIEDDHIPFLRRNVPIIHLIATPFPSVWHKMTDDREAVDVFTVDNINKVFRVFVLEYLHINVV